MNQLISSNEDDATRIHFINRGCVVAYEKAENITNRFKRIIEQAHSHRMRGMLIVGPSGNGKTTLLLFMMDEYGRVQNEETGEFRQSVVYSTAPTGCDQKQFLIFLLEALGCPTVYKTRNEMFRQVIQLLKHLGTKVLIIDEFQQLMEGTPRQQQDILTMIKMISDKVGLSIVGAGLSKAENAVLHDEQLYYRLPPIDLPLWTTKLEGIKEYRGMLKTFEEWLPLRQKSNLSGVPMAKKINEITRGLLGEVAALLKASAIYAIQMGAECISESLLDEVLKKDLYTPPPAELVRTPRKTRK